MEEEERRGRKCGGGRWCKNRGSGSGGGGGGGRGRRGGGDAIFKRVHFHSPTLAFQHARPDESSAWLVKQIYSRDRVH